jgi:hypothetical protein
MASQLRIGDRVIVATPYSPAPRVGTITEIRKHKGLAVIQWDRHDFLGFGVSTRTLDILRKVTS